MGRLLHESIQSGDLSLSALSPLYVNFSEPELMDMELDIEDNAMDVDPVESHPPQDLEKVDDAMLEDAPDSPEEQKEEVEMRKTRRQSAAEGNGKKSMKVPKVVALQEQLGQTGDLSLLAFLRLLILFYCGGESNLENDSQPDQTSSLVDTEIPPSQLYANSRLSHSQLASFLKTYNGRLFLPLIFRK